MTASKSGAKHRCRLSSAVGPASAHLDRPCLEDSDGGLSGRLFAYLSSAALPPLSADCALVAFDTSPEIWTLAIWSAEHQPGSSQAPAPPEATWLARVVSAGARFAADCVSVADEGAHGTFPWLADARAWLALPIEDASGARIGAIAVATRSPKVWQSRHDRQLRQIVEEADAEIQNAWLRAELAKSKRELSVAHAETAGACQRRDAMIAVLGHELRNPLAPMQTALELLCAESPPTSRPRLMVLSRQLRQLRRLVDDLLDFSRLFRRQLELEIESLRLDDVVKRAVEHVQPLLTAREHTLEVRVAADLELEADDARLVQILVVLLSNAAKHTPPRRRITLSAKRAADRIEISVTDDGGIEATRLAGAFEPFEGSNKFDHGGGGLGLGLPIARALADLHRGELQLSSAGPGSGTRAVVRLPCVQHSTSAPHHDRPQRCELLVPRSVLVVDDNHDAAEMLADAVQLCGGSAVVAYDGPTALERAREQRFDLALIDIGLPQMNGFELAQELRKLEDCRNLKIVAVTGFGEPSDRARSKEAGIDVHLVKPISIPELGRLFSARGEA